MKRREFLRTTAAALAPYAMPAAQNTPNIVVILADDVGYGDLSCYGATKVKTPNLDRIAKEGIRFTDAHSSSATCTPTRYSLITGEYAWRKKGTGILPGDAAMIVEPGRTTIASVLKSAGYKTAAVGKWHLGLGAGKIDWNGEIKPGPREIGFDYSFLIPATGDRVPCVYVENGRVVGLDPKDPIAVSYGAPIGNEPTGKDHPEMLKVKLSRGHDNTIVNGVSRIGYMTGGKSARWVDEDMADTITRKAVGFIDRNKSGPFFLYFATHDVHVPRVPHRRFQNTTSCSIRCDALVQLDHCVGEVLKALDRNRIAGDTLILFTSDNGPVLNDGYDDGAEEKQNGHTPAGLLRGGKYSLFEGGTRMPFVLRWPKRVKPGVSDALLCQVDLLSSFAALTGQKLTAAAAPDSFNVLPALLGESKTGRDHLVEHANGLALRIGTWKYIPSLRLAPKKGGDQPAQLYDLSQDIGEKTNLAAAHPARVREMQERLQALQANPRSRP
ncbi:MAG: arylsulfatase [Bryobacterales bacterium]|nr:arylsulfatase [Bryobacterales bacterium]